MKNLAVIILSTLAVTAALFVMFAETDAAGAAFAVAGVLALLHLDYGRKAEPLWAPASAIPFAQSARKAPELLEAAPP